MNPSDTYIRSCVYKVYEDVHGAHTNGQCTRCITCSQFPLHVFSHFFIIWIALFTSSANSMMMSQALIKASLVHVLFRQSCRISFLCLNQQPLLLSPDSLEEQCPFVSVHQQQPSIHFSSPTTARASTSLRYCTRNKSRMSSAGRKEDSDIPQICLCTRTPWVRQLKQGCLFCQCTVMYSTYNLVSHSGY